MSPTLAQTQRQAESWKARLDEHYKKMGMEPPHKTFLKNIPPASAFSGGYTGPQLPSTHKHESVHIESIKMTRFLEARFKVNGSGEDNSSQEHKFLQPGYKSLYGGPSLSEGVRDFLLYESLTALSESQELGERLLLESLKTFMGEHSIHPSHWQSESGSFLCDFVTKVTAASRDSEQIEEQFLDGMTTETRGMSAGNQNAATKLRDNMGRDEKRRAATLQELGKAFVELGIQSSEVCQQACDSSGECNAVYVAELARAGGMGALIEAMQSASLLELSSDPNLARAPSAAWAEGLVVSSPSTKIPGTELSVGFKWYESTGCDPNRSFEIFVGNLRDAARIAAERSARKPAKASAGWTLNGNVFVNADPHCRSEHSFNGSLDDKFLEKLNTDSYLNGYRTDLQQFYNEALRNKTAGQR